MFGYVNIYRDELKIKDYNVFKAYYCGLCKTLGKKHNQIVRLGLSYDMTFLSILADSICDEEPVYKNEGCVKHVGKKMICVNNKAIDYSADMSVLMTYHKLNDDISDEHSIKAFFLKVPYISPFKRTSEKYELISNLIYDSLNRLNELELKECSCTDEVADCFASLTKYIFEGFDVSLGAIGYNIGRFIYILDAYTDIDKDIKSRSYNPYVCIHKDDLDYLKSIEFINCVRGSLNMTLNALSNAYQKISVKRNKAILDNIIYMGLRNNFEKYFKVTEENK